MDIVWNRRRAVLLLSVVMLLATTISRGAADDKSGTLRFGVGPLQATPTETKKAYEPFFAYLAKQLDRDFDLVATTDWAGISVALANKQVDLAWMGPWGYILAHDDSGVRAIATAKYDGKPIYHAIVVCKPGLVKGWPDGGKGKRVSFADVGLDLGLAHPHRVVQEAEHRSQAVLQLLRRRHARRQRDRGGQRPGRLRDRLRPQPQRDDRGRQAREERDRDRVDLRSRCPTTPSRCPRTSTPPWPTASRSSCVGITEEQAKTILPNHYTGFVVANHDSYRMIEDAGRPRRPHQEEVDGDGGEPGRRVSRARPARGGSRRAAALHRSSSCCSRSSTPRAGTWPGSIPAKLLTGLPKMAGWAVKAWPPATDELPVLLLPHGRDHRHGGDRHHGRRAAGLAAVRAGRPQRHAEPGALLSGALVPQRAAGRGLVRLRAALRGRGGARARSRACSGSRCTRGAARPSSGRRPSRTFRPGRWRRRRPRAPRG